TWYRRTWYRLYDLHNRPLHGRAPDPPQKSGTKKPGLNKGSAGITSVPGLFSELFNVAASRPAQMTTEPSKTSLRRGLRQGKGLVNPGGQRPHGEEAPLRRLEPWGRTGLHPSRRGENAASRDEISNPHGEEHGNAVRLEPRGLGASGHPSRCAQWR